MPDSVTTLELAAFGGLLGAALVFVAALFTMFLRSGPPPAGETSDDSDGTTGP